MKVFNPIPCGRFVFISCFTLVSVYILSPVAIHLLIHCFKVKTWNGMDQPFGMVEDTAFALLMSQFSQNTSCIAACSLLDRAKAIGACAGCYSLRVYLCSGSFRYSRMRGYSSWLECLSYSAGYLEEGAAWVLTDCAWSGSIVSINGGCGWAGSSMNEVDCVVSFPPVFIAGPIRVHCFNHLGAVVVLWLVFIR